MPSLQEEHPLFSDCFQYTAWLCELTYHSMLCRSICLDCRGPSLLMPSRLVSSEGQLYCYTYKYIGWVLKWQHVRREAKLQHVGSRIPNAQLQIPTYQQLIGIPDGCDWE